MQQYFMNTVLSVGETTEMNKEQAHHIERVLRMKQKEVIRLVDIHGNLFLAQVLFQQGKVLAKITEAITDHTKTKVNMLLAQGLIKGEKWDYLLQKSAELGVAEILPFTSSRCVVKTKDDKIDKKLQRWNKILLEACEQCKRSTLVKLHAPCDFHALKEVAADVKLIAYEDADIASERLCDVLAAHPHAKQVCMVVGSEGGFSLDEVKELEASGFVRVSLGARILRAETAALSLLNSIEFYYDMAGEQV